MHGWMGDGKERGSKTVLLAVGMDFLETEWKPSAHYQKGC